MNIKELLDNHDESKKVFEQLTGLRYINNQRYPCPICSTTNNAKVFDFVKREKSNALIGHCFACGYGGNLISLLMNFLKKTKDDVYSELSNLGYEVFNEKDMKESDICHFIFKKQKDNIETIKTMPHFLQSVNERKISPEVLQKNVLFLTPKYLKFILTPDLQNTLFSSLGVSMDTSSVDDKINSCIRQDTLASPLISYDNKFCGIAFCYISTEKEKRYKIWRVKDAPRAFMFENKISRYSKNLYITEGWFTNLTLRNWGLSTVSISGTGSADDSSRIKELFDFYPNLEQLYLCLDFDEAGIKKTEKLINQLSELGFNKKISVFCPTSNVASFIKIDELINSGTMKNQSVLYQQFISHYSFMIYKDYYTDESSSKQTFESFKKALLNHRNNRRFISYFLKELSYRIPFIYEHQQEFINFYMNATEKFTYTNAQNFWTEFDMMTNQDITTKTELSNLKNHLIALFQKYGA